MYKKIFRHDAQSAKKNMFKKVECCSCSIEEQFKSFVSNFYVISLTLEKILYVVFGFKS